MSRSASSATGCSAGPTTRCGVSMRLIREQGRWVKKEEGGAGITMDRVRGAHLRTLDVFHADAVLPFAWAVLLTLACGVVEGRVIAPNCSLLRCSADTLSLSLRLQVEPRSLPEPLVARGVAMLESLKALVLPQVPSGFSLRSQIPDTPACAEQISTEHKEQSSQGQRTHHAPHWCFALSISGPSSRSPIRSPPGATVHVGKATSASTQSTRAWSTSGQYSAISPPTPGRYDAGAFF